MRVFFFLLLMVAGFAESEELDLTHLEAALEKRDTYETVVAKVTQEKVLPSLNEKVVVQGKLWLIPQVAFRWEQGEPVSDIAVYDEGKVYLLDEKGKELESYKPTSRAVRPLMLLLGMGEDSTYKGLLDSFKPVTVIKEGADYTVTFLPDSGLMKRAVKELSLTLDLKTSYPTQIVWEQKDGTIITTRFSELKFNREIAEELFKVDLSSYIER